MALEINDPNTGKPKTWVWIAAGGVMLVIVFVFLGKRGTSSDSGAVIPAPGASSDISQSLSDLNSSLADLSDYLKNGGNGTKPPTGGGGSNPPVKPPDPVIPPPSGYVPGPLPPTGGVPHIDDPTKIITQVDPRERVGFDVPITRAGSSNIPTITSRTPTNITNPTSLQTVVPNVSQVIQQISDAGSSALRVGSTHPLAPTPTSGPAFAATTTKTVAATAAATTATASATKATTAVQKALSVAGSVMQPKKKAAATATKVKATATAPAPKKKAASTEVRPAARKSATPY